MNMTIPMLTMMKADSLLNHPRSASEPLLSSVIFSPKGGNLSLRNGSENDISTQQLESDDQPPISTPPSQETSSTDTDTDTTHRTVRRSFSTTNDKRNMYACYRTTSAPSVKRPSRPNPFPAKKTTPARAPPPKGAYESPEKLQLRKSIPPAPPPPTQKIKRKKSFGITVHRTKSQYPQSKSEVKSEPNLVLDMALPTRKVPRKMSSIQSPARRLSMSCQLSEQYKDAKEYIEKVGNNLNEYELSLLIEVLYKMKNAKTQVTQSNKV